MPPVLRSYVKGPSSPPAKQENAAATVNPKKTPATSEPENTRNTEKPKIIMRLRDPKAPPTEDKKPMPEVTKASLKDEKEANANFSAFVTKYYLDDNGRPDRSKTRHPIAFELYNQDNLWNMRTVVNDIQGLVLLRPDSFNLVIGWNTAMLPHTCKAFEKRKSLHICERSQQGDQLAVEPKFFFGQYLGINLNSPGPTPKEHRRNHLVTVEISQLMEPSVDHVMVKEPELVLDSCGSIAILRWNRESVDAERERLHATQIRRAAEKEGELLKSKKYWTERAEVHKGQQSDAYFWALHNIIRAKNNRAPGPATKFDVSCLAGSYIVKTKCPTSRFGCQGREARSDEMKLHVEPDTRPGQEGRFIARFNFGLIKGMMHLSADEERVSSRSRVDPDNAVTEAVQRKDVESRFKSYENYNPRGKKRQFEEDSHGSIESSSTAERPQKRVRLDIPSPKPRQDAGHKTPNANSETPETPRTSRKEHRHTIKFSFTYQLTDTKNSTNTEAPQAVLYMDEDNRGRFLYYDGDAQVYLGAKGYLRCLGISDGLNKISIYRISEGKPIDTA
ncbi:hypothetical protein V8F33_009787 [Rhypophila sp. PSN 637]